MSKEGRSEDLDLDSIESFSSIKHGWTNLFKGL